MASVRFAQSPATTLSRSCARRPSKGERRLARDWRAAEAHRPASGR
jgi:hypothetical protein